jgi:hypothetical protein
MTLMPTTLRLEAEDHSGVEEYRIYEGVIEVRKLERSGEPITDDAWQRLTHTQLAKHVNDNTVVARWLRHRIGWQRLLRACINPQTLAEFGIPENTLDRYAA